MNNLLEELKERYKVLLGSRDKNNVYSYSAIVAYLTFVKDTFPLNNIALTILSSSSLGGMAGRAAMGGIKDFLGEKKENHFQSSPLIPQHGLYFFHEYMIDALKKQGYGKRRAITRDIDGDYFYRSKLPFNKNTTYYHLFDFLFCRADNSASYKDINTYLSSKGCGAKVNSPEKISEHIRNAIKQYKRNKARPSQIVGTPVLEVKRGFVQLNNPEL